MNSTLKTVTTVPTLNLTKRATNYGKLVRDFLAGLPLAASGATEVAV